MSTLQTDQDSRIVLAVLGLPARLKAHRAARNLSLREVGRETGLSFSTLCRIEQGKDFAVSSLLAVAAYLDGER